MSELNVCRICLRAEGKMYYYDKFDLKSYYEDLMALEVENPDNLPHYFCYECAAVLYKFHKFKEKCYAAYNTLEGLLWENTLPLKSVLDVDRKSKNLISPLGLISKCAKVKSCVVKSHLSKKSHKIACKEPTPKNEIKIEFGETTMENTVENTIDKLTDFEFEAEIFIKEQNNIKIEEDKSEKENTMKIDNNDNEDIDDVELNEVGGNDSDDVPVSKAIYREKNYKKRKTAPKPKTTKIQNRPPKPKKVPQKVGRKRVKELDPKLWIEVTLTEEQALLEFQARAQSSKYFTAEYKCKKCFKGFSREDILKRHIRVRHSDANPEMCRFCKTTYTQKGLLTHHMQEHYKKYKCLVCDLICVRCDIAYAHEDMHKEIIRKCQHCGKEFKHLNTYNSHLRMSHRSEYVCTLCGVSFINNKGLSQHKNTKHPTEETVINPDYDGEGEYCERCDIKFETRKAYDEHFLHSAKHDDVKDLEGNTPKLLKPRRVDISKRVFTRKNHPTNCHTCGKYFHSQASFKKHHMAEHPKTSMFPPTECHICEICGKSVYPGNMRAHLITHGVGSYGSSVTCSECGKTFANSGSLKCHFNTFHETDPSKKIKKKQKFACDICGVVVTMKASLKRHMLIHTGERPHKCELCGKRFTQSNVLKLHFRTIHLKEPHPKRKPRNSASTRKKKHYIGEDQEDSD